MREEPRPHSHRAHAGALRAARTVVADVAAIALLLAAIVVGIAGTLWLLGRLA